MINQKALEAVKNSRFSKEFCRPLYDSYCFSKIPGTIFKLLTGHSTEALPSDTWGAQEKAYDSVILLFLDGFGWSFFEKYYDRFPFLSRIVEKGIASKITSLFPSTTAAHVTCLNTGLESARSGIYEWFILEPKLSRIIAPLPYCFAGEHHPGSLKNENISTHDIFPTQTIYHELKKKQIESFALLPLQICDSPYSNTMLSGAHVFGYHHLSDGLIKLIDLYEQNKGKKSYFYLYFPDIDSLAHRKGIDSPEFEEAIERCFTSLEEFFWSRFSPKNCAVIAIADHGLTAVYPEKTYYLNQQIPQIKKNFLTGADEKPLAPAGSCRDFFLHIREDKLLETKELLEKSLGNMAEVYLTTTLIKEGLFGTKGTTDAFLSRVGNLVILSKQNEAVWWYEKHRFAQGFHASHGGLTREEMETIFLFLNC
ncbi:MAG TPA: alkaline phosphatase family protein [Rhabdochlamydiaceae bacterium]|nr:alkaline phosphatase family protein [Rhabdochlamydiaceae bacterium]